MIKKLVLLFCAVLALAKSEYVTMHENDPVRWKEWNKNIFKEAEKKHRLIFISIGYSTCHWCHVMQKESFKNPEIAEILNTHYIPVIIDKEEHPQIDRYYLWVYKQVYLKDGGWPLNVILTPDKKIVFIKGYLPPEDFFKTQGLKSVLEQSYRKFVKGNLKPLKIKPLKIKNHTLSGLKRQILSQYNRTFGGFNSLKSFPFYGKYELLFDIYLLSKNRVFINMLNKTLNTVAKSGLYDQVEGGFFRHSVYDDFSLPHFEKMLYVNALLSELYAKVYRYTKNPLYKKTVIKTISLFDKKYKDKSGLYYASNSADSPHEGDYFCFTYSEFENALKNIPNKNEILNYIHAEKDGNFERGKNHIYLHYSKKTPANFDIFIKNLEKIRQKRKYPFLDKKIILSWNLMMVNALFEAGYIDKKYIKQGENLLQKLLATFYKKGVLYHSYVDKMTQKAHLEDFAYLVRALICAYEHTQKKEYLKKAGFFIKLSKKFYKNGRWSDGEFEASITEKGYPSALSTLFNAYLNYSTITDDMDLYYFTKNSLKNYSLNFNYPTLSKAVLKTMLPLYSVKSKNVKIYYPFFYPFYVWKKNPNRGFEICSLFSCQKSAKEIDEIDTFFKKIRY